MGDRHVVVGAGPVGRAVVEELARAGREVVLVSRSGTGPEVPGAVRHAADATDAEGLSRIAAGASTIYNCINPPSYDVWRTYWPPVAAALLATAERTGAVLATAASLYPYGPVDVPMTEDLPDVATGIKARIRAGMTADAMAAHRAGRLRAVEVRGSDYLGSGVGQGAHLTRVVPRALQGHGVWLFGRADQPHSFTDVQDMGRALVAVADRESAWGRVWHAPTNPALSQRQSLDDICRSVGAEPVAVHTYPRAMLSVGGLAVPLLRELRETVYQFERPYVLDSSAIEAELGIAPTPWDEVCRRTARG